MIVVHLDMSTTVHNTVSQFLGVDNFIADQ